MTLDELQALADAATPGPWEIAQHSYSGQFIWVSTLLGDIAEICDWPPEQCLATARFIAACRTEVPKLIAEVRRLRYDNKNWLAAHWGGLFADGKISAQEHDSRIAKLEEATGET